MKTNFLETTAKLEVEVGDVLVLYSGKNYLIVKTDGDEFPFTLIDLDTMGEINSYGELPIIAKTFRNRIKRITKHKNLEIREVE